jgi:hypothetical protein
MRQKTPPEYVQKTQKLGVLGKMDKFVKPFGTKCFANMRAIN